MGRAQLGLAAFRPVRGLDQNLGFLLGQPVLDLLVPRDRPAGLSRQAQKLDHAAREFRDDFYYRLSAAEIEVPTLRQRIAEDPQELDRLVAVLVRRIVGQGTEALAAQVVQTVVEQRGLDDPWPGNVRELEQCVRHIVLTGKASPRRAVGRRREGSAEVEEIDVDTLVSRHCAALYTRYRSYEAVGRIVGLDRRTVKKHVERGG